MSPAKDGDGCEEREGGCEEKVGGCEGKEGDYKGEWEAGRSRKPQEKSVKQGRKVK